MSFPNAWGLLREGGGGSDGHLSLLLLFVGVGYIVWEIQVLIVYAGMLD